MTQPCTPGEVMELFIQWLQDKGLNDLFVLFSVLGPSIDLPAMMLLMILSLLAFFTPIALYWAHNAQPSVTETGYLLKIDIFQSYSKLVALCRLSKLVRSHALGNVDLQSPSNQAALDSFCTLRDATIETMRQRLAVRLKEWHEFSAQVSSSSCIVNRKEFPAW